MPGVEPWALGYGLRLSSHAEAVPTQPQHPEAATSFSVRKTLPRGYPSDWVQDSDVLTGSDHTGAASSSSTLVDSTWVFRLWLRVLPQVDRRGQHGGRAGEGSLAGTGLWMATPWPGTLSSHQSRFVAKIPCLGRCDQHLPLLLRSQRFHQCSLWSTSEFTGLTHNPEVTVVGRTVSASWRKAAHDSLRSRNDDFPTAELMEPLPPISSSPSPNSPKTPKSCAIREELVNTDGWGRD